MVVAGPTLFPKFLTPPDFPSKSRVSSPLYDARLRPTRFLPNSCTLFSCPVFLALLAVGLWGLSRDNNQLRLPTSHIDKTFS